VNGTEGTTIEMSQLPSWTQEVSERLIDIQKAAERRDARTIALIHETQEYLDEVQKQINGYCTALRTGQMPRRMLRAMTHDEPEAA
jgi:Na+/phosphate symporter